MNYPTDHYQAKYQQLLTINTDDINNDVLLFCSYTKLISQNAELNRHIIAFIIEIVRTDNQIETVNDNDDKIEEILIEANRYAVKISQELSPEMSKLFIASYNFTKQCVKYRSGSTNNIFQGMQDTPEARDMAFCISSSVDTWCLPILFIYLHIHRVPIEPSQYDQILIFTVIARIFNDMIYIPSTEDLKYYETNTPNINLHNYLVKRLDQYTDDSQVANGGLVGGLATVASHGPQVANGGLATVASHDLSSHLFSLLMGFNAWQGMYPTIKKAGRYDKFEINHNIFYNQPDQYSSEPLDETPESRFTIQSIDQGLQHFLKLL